MSEHKCFFCNKTIAPQHVKKKVRCIYCGSKILFKERASVTKVLAR